MAKTQEEKQAALAEIDSLMSDIKAKFKQAMSIAEENGVAFSADINEMLNDGNYGLEATYDPRWGWDTGGWSSSNC